MKWKTRIFWVWISMREFAKHGKTDYNLAEIMFAKNPINRKTISRIHNSSMLVG